VAEATDAAGLRALLGEVLYDFPSPNYGPPEAGLRYTRELIARWRGHDRVRIAVEPHAPYTCSPGLLQDCARLAAECDVPLITHLAETAHEEGTVRERYGLSPVRHLERLGLLTSRLIADHGVHLAGEEVELLAARGVAVVHNPESNMKLASGAAPVTALLRAGIRVGLGTDGCASNNNLDLFQEMDSAAKLQKLVRQDPTALPAGEVVRLATAMGAGALGLGHLVGALTPGKAADLIVVDFDQPHLTPVYDYTSHLVYCVRGADVTDTMVAGRWLLRNRSFTTVDPERVCGRVREIAGQVRRLVGNAA
jgi:5-methylthioadenosine/S-adenosylhomocysteine deaminase